MRIDRTIALGNALALAALSLTGWAESPPIDLTRLPQPTAPVLDLVEPNRAAVVLERPETGTPAAELVALATVVTEAIDPAVADTTVEATLKRWLAMPASDVLQHQRAAVLLNLGASDPAQTILDPMGLPPVTQLAVDQLVPQGFSLPIWRQQMRARLKSPNTVNNAAQPLSPMQASVINLLAGEMVTEAPRVTVGMPPMTVTFSAAEQAFLLRVLPLWGEGQAAAEQAYRAVAETLVSVDLSPMAKIHQREALLPFIAGQLATIQSTQQAVARASVPKVFPNYLPKNPYGDLKGAITQWLQVQAWSLRLLQSQLAVPAIGHPAGETAPITDATTIIQPLTEANQALQAVVEPFTRSPLQLPTQQTLFNAHHVADVTFTLTAAQQLIPVITTVWQGLTIKSNSPTTPAISEGAQKL